MNRRALIISNPGLPGTETYCEGVKRDVENYKSFLLSASGGLWWESEIVLMDRPSEVEVIRKLTAASSCDYVLVVFSGHGSHSTSPDTTILELGGSEEIDSSDLKLDAIKQTIILDCCRKKLPTTPLLEVRESLKFAKGGSAINPSECRKYYNKRIEECPNEPVVVYSCAVDELAADDSQRGGIYSYHLLKESRAWANEVNVDTSTDFRILSIVEAHNIATPIVQRAREFRQNPQIQKARTGPYYPFSIVA